MSVKLHYQSPDGEDIEIDVDADAGTSLAGWTTKLYDPTDDMTLGSRVLVEGQPYRIVSRSLRPPTAEEVADDPMGFIEHIVELRLEPLAVNRAHQSPSEPKSDDPEGPDRA